MEPKERRRSSISFSEGRRYCDGVKTTVAGEGAGACAFASGTGSPSAIAKFHRLNYYVFTASHYTRVSGAHERMNDKNIAAATDIAKATGCSNGKPRSLPLNN